MTNNFQLNFSLEDWLMLRFTQYSSNVCSLVNASPLQLTRAKESGGSFSGVIAVDAFLPSLTRVAFNFVIMYFIILIFF